MSLDFRNIWDTYALAWKATAAAEKHRLLKESTSPDCVYRDPANSTTGHEALVAYMRSFHEQVPEGHFVTTYFLAHHNRSIAKWNMHGADGAVLGDGISYGEYGEDGRLVAMTGFFEAPQA